MACLPYVKPYYPEFLGDGYRVPLPKPCCSGSLAFGGAMLDYIHYSLLMHRDRRSAVYGTNNVDISRLRHPSVGRNWAFDPRLASDTQTGPGVYDGTDWDKGHLVMRFHATWGDDDQEARDGSDSTHYYTNAAPQRGKFNRDEWEKLGTWMIEGAPAFGSRLCVFTGPLYTKQDQVDRGVRIPSAFWKVGVMRDGGVAGSDLVVAGFLMKQNEHWDDWGGGVVNFRIYQVGLKELQRAAGLDFGELTALDDDDWRVVRFRDRRRMGWIPIGGPEDVRFFGNRRRSAGIRALRVGGPDGSTPPADPGCGCAEGGDAQAPLDPAVGALADQLLAMQSMLSAGFARTPRGS